MSVRSDTSSASGFRVRSRSLNKIYRAPPTPTGITAIEREKGFILDCHALSSISREHAKSNPKTGDGIPPYNAQKDGLTYRYWKFPDVDKTLRKTGQNRGGTSIQGPVIDFIHEKGNGSQYLNLRNRSGAGHSEELTDGHAQYLSGLKPIIGYHGYYGYRRNTPCLRKFPSPFGITPNSPTH
ncbi:hypothetical protein FSP39_011456 [Pinctada imbricata]|uniref:Uncharacterized protein n=1 Tax=Pinctada imbricata TaxID=66713 RepID=A0AA88YJK0_PINIB|nr:hypothetical protein FSP39_011456 [Pinctada imbricata]